MKIRKLVAERLIPKGHENAISSRALRSILRISERELRSLIQAMRIEDGIVVCASDSGYFRPKDRAEILAFYKRMRNRGVSCIRAAKSARLALMEMDGQMALDFSTDGEEDDALMNDLIQEGNNPFEVDSDGQYYIIQESES